MNARVNLKHRRVALVVASAFFVVHMSFAPLVYAQGLPTQTDPTNTAANVGTQIAAGKSLVEGILQTAKSFAMHFKEFIGDSLANIVAKAALRSITQSTVNWINSGFKGSPSFVTNPEGFLLDVADQVAGQAIEELAPLLCGPFRIDIRAMLGLNLSFNASHDVRCRLTDVINNVQGSYDSFVAGNFGAGGWNSWINIAGVQQNNPYGAYLKTADAASIRITNATGEAVFQRQIGHGFLDFRECEVPGEPIVLTKNVTKTNDAGNQYVSVEPRTTADGKPLTRAGPCKQKGPIKTPGSVIEGQLQNALGVDLQGLAVADEINEIFAALVNQLMKTVLSSSGLAGAKSYKSSSFNEGIPASDDPKVNGYIDQLNTVRDKAKAESGTVQNVAFNGQLGADTTQGQNVNNTVVGGINTQAGAAGQAAGAGGVGSGTTGAYDVDLSANTGGKPRITRQSTTAPNVIANTVSDSGVAHYGSDRANDDNNDTVSKTISDTNPWWEVDLGAPYTIDTVKIWKNKDLPANSLEDAYIFITAGPYGGSGIDTNAGVRVNLPTPEPIPFTVDVKAAPSSINKTGRYLRVQRVGTNKTLSLAEIKIFQTGDPALRKGVPLETNLAPVVTNAQAGSFTRKSDAQSGSFTSDKGIDGMREGNYSENTASGFSLVKVANPNLPWWEVDLGSSKNIGEVKIWRRTDLSFQGQFLSNAYIFVSDAPFSGTGNQVDWGTGVPVPVHTLPEERPITVPVNATGRYVRLQRNTLNQELWFSELEVYPHNTASDRSRPATAAFSISPEFGRWVDAHNGNFVNDFDVKNNTQGTLTISWRLNFGRGAAPFQNVLNSLDVTVTKGVVILNKKCGYLGLVFGSCDGYQNTTNEENSSFTLGPGETAHVKQAINLKMGFGCVDSVRNYWYTYNCFYNQIVMPAQLGTDLIMTLTGGGTLKENVISFMPMSQ